MMPTQSAERNAPAKPGTMCRIGTALLIGAVILLKVLKWLVILGAVVAGVLFAYLNSRPDDPPPDETGLRVTYEQIPDEKNAFYHFQRAAEALVLPEDRNEKRRFDDLLNIPIEDHWHPEFAATLLEQNQTALEYVARGLACARCQLPECRTYEDMGLPPVPLRGVATLGGIRARLLFENGQQEEAFDQLMSIVRFGARMQNGRGSTIAYLVGMSIKYLGLCELRRALARDDLNPELLRSLIDRLADYGASIDGLTDTYRIEYARAIATIDNWPRRARKRSWMFKPNRTKRLFAQATRMMIESAPKTYAEATLPDLDEPSERGTWGTVKHWLSGDVLGEGLYRGLFGVSPSTHGSKCRENCLIGATQIMIALKCHQLEHGDLPDTLDELVPTYFDAVPLDDFDGKPMKYSKDKRVVYAVGTDLADNGGVAEGDKESVIADGYDVIYKIPF